MKKKKDYTIELLLLLFLFAILASCSRKVTGVVTEVRGDTITVNNKRFIIYDSVPAVGKQVVFMPTKTKSKVTAKKL